MSGIDAQIAVWRGEAERRALLTARGAEVIFFPRELAAGFRELLLLSYERRPATATLRMTLGVWRRVLWRRGVPLVGGRRRGWRATDAGRLLAGFRSYAELDDMANFPLPSQVHNLIPPAYDDVPPLPPPPTREDAALIARTLARARRIAADEGVTLGAAYTRAWAEFNRLPAVAAGVGAPCAPADTPAAGAGGDMPALSGAESVRAAAAATVSSAASADFSPAAAAGTRAPLHCLKGPA